MSCNKVSLPQMPGFGSSHSFQSGMYRTASQRVMPFFIMSARACQLDFPHQASKDGGLAHGKEEKECTIMSDFDCFLKLSKAPDR